jgi:hypothetical protein
MNHIEKGIYDAHEMVAAEEQERKAADVLLREAIDAETENRRHGDEQEAEARNQQITEAINGEADARLSQIQELNTQVQNEFASINEQIQMTNDVLDGVHSISLIGATLTRVLGGFTEVPKNLFEFDTVFTAGKTLIFDTNGTTGVYTTDADSANIIVLTKSISPLAALEPVLLGSVAVFENLPLTVASAETVFGRTPRIDDYAQVMSDANFSGLRVEYYVTAIDANGNITWGNPVPLNTADFQTQTGAEDSGRVLTGGPVPGTFGESLDIDMEPTQASKNLINSGGVFAWVESLLNAFQAKIFLLSHPVNSLYMTVAPDESTPAQMTAKYGGTWSVWGTGRVPVSLNLNDRLY